MLKTNYIVCLAILIIALATMSCGSDDSFFDANITDFDVEIISNIDHSATIAWNPSISNVGSEVTYYVYLERTRNKPTLEGLTQDTTYTIEEVPIGFSLNGYVEAFDTLGNSKRTEFILEQVSSTFNFGLTLSTQEAVDEFFYKEIRGDLVIEGEDIIDISPLKSLQVLYGGGLTIRNTGLSSLNGLQNVLHSNDVTSLPRDHFWIRIINNPNLVSIDSLLNFVPNINYPQGVEDFTNPCNSPEGWGFPNDIIITDNDRLVDVKGLSNVTQIRSLIVENNQNLISLIGLNGLETVFQNIYIKGNNSLSQINFSNLQRIVRPLHNFQNVSCVGDKLHFSFTENLLIEDNDEILNVGNFNLNKVGGIRIEGNLNLKFLDGLQIGEVNNLIIRDNDNLEHLNGLSNIASIANQCYRGFDEEKVYRLEISDNEKLKDVNGLIGVDKRISYLVISDNPSLNNLNGLENTVFTLCQPYQVNLESDLDIKHSELVIKSNGGLLDYCGLIATSNLEIFSGYSEINSNGFNPSFDDLISGVCSE